MSFSKKYPHLFEPLQVNQMMIPNRIISAPLGSLTDKSVSGIGMIIRGTSGSVPGPRSRMAPGSYCFANMQESQKVREQVVTIQQRGAKAEFELCHVGQYAYVQPGDYAIGPVGFVREDGIEVKAMDENMMNEVADAFAKGAVDAKEYGFDMVMLHFGHGWLPTQFLSPHYNKRTDGYGGCFENRVKIPIQIVERVRQAVGPDYPLDMRISGFEYIEDGTPIDEIIRFIQLIEDKIDMEHISCGLEREIKAMTKMSSTPYFDHKINVQWSQKVKEYVHIPVAVVGAIMTPEEAEEILANHQADAVVIGRQIIADPFWTSKAIEEKSEDIVPCLRCMNCYNQYARNKDRHYGMKSITCCSVNPRYLHEQSVPVELSKAKTIKKVYVIGGGPAGCKAALTAYERGHQVILFEKTDVLGGQLSCSEFDKSKQDLKRYKDYLITQIHKSSIEVRLQCDALEDIDEIKTGDSLIVAVGAKPISLEIAGIQQKHVMDALYAYGHQNEINQKVVIIGGGSIGSELAKLLCHLGKDVTIVEKSEQLCSNVNEHIQTGLLEKLSECQNLKIFLNSQCLSIQNQSVVIQNNTDLQVIEAQSVIVAVGMQSRCDIVNQFYGLVPDINVIGDAKRPGTVAQATHDGYYAGVSL